MGSLRESLKIKESKGAPSKKPAAKSATLGALFAEDSEQHVVTALYEAYLEGLRGKFTPPEWTAKNHGERKVGCLHPSSFSSCPRALQYEWLGAKNERYFSPKTNRVFAVGHYMHKMIQTDLLRAGLLVHDEVPVVHNKLKIQGHTDGLLRWPDEFHSLLEIKTINPRDFKTLVQPSNDYLIQANCYLLCVERERKILRKSLKRGSIVESSLNKFRLSVSKVAHPLTQINFYYYDKGSGDTKEFIINRDEEIVAGIEEKAETILSAMDRHKLLPRVADGPTEQPCAGCGYRNQCFDQINSKKVDWTRYQGR